MRLCARLGQRHRFESMQSVECPRETDNRQQWVPVNGVIQIKICCFLDEVVAKLNEIKDEVICV